MDYEFFIRLSERGYKFRHIPYIMADFRWHQDSKSSLQVVRQKEEMEKALMMHDHLLSALRPLARFFFRNYFMLLARAKRTVLKLFRGAY